MVVPKTAEGWVNNGIYLLENVNVASPCEWNYKTQNYELIPFQFKVKHIRPVLYFCTVSDHYGTCRVTLTRINSDSQFVNKGLAPFYQLHADHYENREPYFTSYVGSKPRVFSLDDFAFLGVESHLVRATYWGPFSSTEGARMMKEWEETAIQKGFFQPNINPLYKSKAERELETAKDFFKQDIKRGDVVAYVVLTGSQRIHTGLVTNITKDNFVIDSSYVAPHNYVIKCPEDFARDFKKSPYL